MDDDEKKIEELEEEFPSLSGVAFSAAYKNALQSGLTVLIAEAGIIYKVFPDGSREIFKHIEKPTTIPVGTQFFIS